MQFPIVQQYKTDLQGINPENQINDEPIQLLGNIDGSIIVIPRHAPFFVESLELKFANGQPMVLNTDYEVYRLMGRLTELCGQGVASLIKIKTPSISSVLADYKTVGEFSLIDNSVLQLIISASEDDRPVRWENLRNKPTSFPPVLHSHSLLYETVAFQDTVSFIKDYADVIRTSPENLLLTDIRQKTELIKHYVSLYGTMLRNYLDRHVNSLNAHGLTKEDIGLEKVDNFETVHPSAALEPRKDKHLTPSGLRAIMDEYGFVSTEFLKADLLPFSRYGSSGFIPPNVGGSFEAIGSTRLGEAFTLSGSNELTMLAPRTDGRVEGLYFTTGTMLEMEYVSYRYEHQFLDAMNVNPTCVIKGSGEQVLMVGDLSSNRLFITLTNGTLDPARHVWSEVDVTVLQSQISASGTFNLKEYHLFLNVSLMGPYVYIHVGSSNTAVDTPIPTVLRSKGACSSFMRFNKALIGDGTLITPVLQNLTFTDCHGVTHTNRDRWLWAMPVYNGSNQITKYVLDWTPYWIGPSGPDTRLTIFTVLKPGTTDVYYIKFLSQLVGNYTPSIGGNMQVTIEAIYEFNITTGEMTHRFNTTGDYKNDLSEVYPSIGVGWVYKNLFGGASPGLCHRTDTYKLEISPRNEDPVSFVSESFETIPDNRWQISEVITSPLPTTTNNEVFLYQPNGLFIYSDSYDHFFFKQVTGKLIERPGVTSLKLPNLLSQPLSNDIRKTLINPRTTGAMIVCPTVAELDTYGVDIGDTAFCFRAQNDYETGFGGGIVLFTDHTITPAPNNMIDHAVVKTINYDENIVERLKLEVNDTSKLAIATDVVVSVCDPTGGRLTDRFGWLPVICMVDVYVASENKVYSTGMVIEPIYANGWVTDFVVKNKFHITHVGAILRTPSLRTANNSNTGYRSVQVFLNANKLSIKVTNEAFRVNGGGFHTMMELEYTNRTTQTLTTGVMKQFGMASTKVANRTIVTPYGFSLITAFSETGGATSTYTAPGGENILLHSTYTPSSWMVYFTTEEEVVFNGRSYTLPVGSIDLRDVEQDPSNKTFYVYVKLVEGLPVYEISLDKKLETVFLLWIAVVKTGTSQIVTIDRQSVFTVNGYRVSKLKRGNAMPATSGDINTEGQLPWIRRAELLPE